MQEQSLEWLIEAARSRVSGARALLVSPRTGGVDHCVTLFREAQGYLEWLRDRLRTAGPEGRELRGQALALDREIRQAGALLEQGARRGCAWLEHWRLSRCGYTTTGRLASVPVGQISILG